MAGSESTMDIADIATKECLEVGQDERIGDARTMLESDGTPGVIVVEDHEPVGVVTPRELLRSQVDDDAAVEAVMSTVPTVDRRTGVREVARVLVESRSFVAPVLEGDERWGCVTADDLLSAVRENLDVLEVREIHTQEVVSATEDTTMAEAINLLRDNGISRLPVVEEDGQLVGIVSVRDLVEFVVRDPPTQERGERYGEDDRLLDLPIRNVMSRPAETTSPEATVGDAVETMLENEYDGLVVTPEYDDLVAGIVTKTDVLRALTVTAEEHPDVSISNVDLLLRTTREEVAARLEEIAGKHEQMTVQHTDVRLQKHEEELRGQQLVRCKVRMRTDQDLVIGTGEAYGGDDALSMALDTLERNVLELKGRRYDEREDLLQTLSEL